jgi:hypothetical protein
MNNSRVVVVGVEVCNVRRMVTTRSSETPVSPYKSTQRYVSEGQHRHLHYENHKSQQYGSKNRELLD